MAQIALLEKIALDRHPVAVYLARLAPSSRRTMHAALNSIAGLLSEDRCDAWSLAWEKLRYRHTTAMRALLADGSIRYGLSNLAATLSPTADTRSARPTAV